MWDASPHGSSKWPLPQNPSLRLNSSASHLLHDSVKPDPTGDAGFGFRIFHTPNRTSFEFLVFNFRRGEGRTNSQFSILNYRRGAAAPGLGIRCPRLGGGSLEFSVLNSGHSSLFSGSVDGNLKFRIQNSKLAWVGGWCAVW